MPAVNIFQPQQAAAPIGFSPFSPGFTKLLWIQKTLTNAQLAVLDVTHVQLVPPPGAGNILIPYYWTVEKNTNAGAFGASGSNFECQWDNASFDGFFILGQIAADLNNARSTIMSASIAQPTIVYSVRDPRNKGLAIRCSTSPGAGGNIANSARVTLYYQVLTGVIGA